MREFLEIFLLIYFIVYFGIVFVIKSIIVAKKTGKNPIVLPKDNSLYGLVGIYFKLTLFCIFIYVLLFAFIPTFYDIFSPISKLDTLVMKQIGIVILLFALIWTIVAQINMRDSWRIGIDTKNKSELITTGLFAFSRNPVFFGMILSLWGLFLTSPNILTGVFFVLGYILIQIQIRLEEEFLVKQHGKKYLEYKKRVRRMI